MLSNSLKIKVAVLFGGKSVEHEISIISGLQAIEHINTEKYIPIPVYMTRNNEMYIGEEIKDIKSYNNIDSLLSKSQQVIFTNISNTTYLISQKTGKVIHQIDVAMPIVHGTNTEDGTLQGYLKTIGVPFTGCDVTSSAIGMDKVFQKTILKKAGIPVLDCLVLNKNDYRDIEQTIQICSQKINYPMIIKPACLGSSIGIGVANTEQELEQKLDDAFFYTDKVLIEKAIINLREINCSVLGDAEQAIASVCEEPLHTGKILTYEDKYGNGSKNGTKTQTNTPTKTQSNGMVDLSRKIPANISEEMAQRIQNYSLQAFNTLNCSGVVRIDYILDNDTQEIFFNEINTIPGSLAFYLWEASGKNYNELLDDLIKIALKRHRTENALSISFETNILK